MEVNKVNSWEDVLSDNYNKEPQVEAEQVAEAVEETVEATQTEEPVVEQTEQVTEQVGEQVVEKIEAKQDDSFVEPQKVVENVSNDIDEDALYEYLQLKRTNYNEIPDIDIVSGYISNEHPRWSEDDINFELEQKYGSALFEEKIDLEEIDKEVYPDEYKEAVAFNKEIEKAQKLLRRDAIERRAELEEIKNNIKLPISNVSSSDGDADLNDKKAESQEPQLSEEQIKELQLKWERSVESDVPQVNEFKFNIGDEEVAYKITEDEQKQMVEKMKQFNAEDYLVKRGWLNEDGTPNVKKITKDVYILENTEKLLKSGWTQAKEKAKMDIISKDIKNINLGSSNQSFDAKAGNPYAFGDYVLDL
jgi:hypothetical protein